MCGRYAATLPPEMMVELFNLLNRIDYPPRYNIAPTQPIPVIWEVHGKRTVQLARWGLVPRWVKDPRQFSLLLNARIEGIEEKPAFREAVRRLRCIVPASGYYEWHVGPGNRRQPYYVTRADGQPMALAGLYTTWEGPNGEEVDTAAIITVPAAPDLEALHPRTPAVLDHDVTDAWLDTDRVPARLAIPLVHQLQPGVLRFHPVSSRVGSTAHDDADLIVPVDLSTPPPTPPRRRAAGGGIQLELF